MRILIIDDEGHAAEALGILLTGRGHDVSVAHDGTAGITIGVAEKFDAALVDLGMPGVDGFDVAKALRLRHGTLVRLIAYTGFTQDAMRQRAWAAGFDAFLLKPSTLDAISAALRSTGGP